MKKSDGMRMGGDDSHCFYALDDKTFLERFIDKLFPESYLSVPEDLEGVPIPFLKTTTTICLDWKDRLRVLLSGRLCVKSQIKTEVICRTAGTWSVTYVLPPRFRDHRRGVR